MKRRSPKLRHVLELVIAIALIIVINIIGNLKFSRIDLTEDKLHTLSDGTIDFLENEIDQVINIEIYLEGEFPAAIQKLKNSIREKIEEFQAYAGKKIKFRFINPNEDKELAKTLTEQLKGSGLFPSFIYSKEGGEEKKTEIWPGATLRYGDREEVIQFLPRGGYATNPRLIQDAVNKLEYKFVTAFWQLTHKERNTIGLLRGHNELSQWETFAIHDELREFYKIDTVSIIDSTGKENLKALNKFDAVIIAKPKLPFTEKEKYIIDQYVMKGGKVVWLIDQIEVPEETLSLKKPMDWTYQVGFNHVYDILVTPKDTKDIDTAKFCSLFKISRKDFLKKMEYASKEYDVSYKASTFIKSMSKEEYSRIAPDLERFKGFEENRRTEGDNLNIDDMLFKYGARINKNLVADISSAPIRRADNGSVLPNWYLHPILNNQNLTKLTKNVAPIKIRYGNSIEAVGSDDIKKTVLLESSKNYKIMPARFRLAYYHNKDAYRPIDSLRTDPDITKPMALLLEGEFTSHFKGRIIDKYIDDPKANYLEKSKPNKMVVIADGDLIRNELTKTQEGGPRPYSLECDPVIMDQNNQLIPVYGNGIFFHNLMDKLMGDEHLISLRSRMKIPRLLDADEVSLNRRSWQVFNLTIPVILVVLLGLIQWFIRRRRFAIK